MGSDMDDDIDVVRELRARGGGRDGGNAHFKELPIEVCELAAAEIERLYAELQGIVDAWDQCAAGNPPPDYDQSVAFLARRAARALANKKSRPMRFEVARASDLIAPKAAPTEAAVMDGDGWFIDLVSLQDLIALSKKERSSLIVSDGQILIYDDSLE